MPYCERDDAKIYYETYGSGFPVLLFAPGGMWSNISKWRATEEEPIRPVHDWTDVLADKFTVVAMDQRNAERSSGALLADHGWDTYTNDQLAIMDDLGFDKFHTIGGCIGGSYCLNIAKLAPERVASVVLQNPIGLHPDHPEYFPGTVDKWAAELMETRDDITPEAVASFRENMFGRDFVFSVDRDFVRTLKTPAMLLHGKDKPHPAVVSAELEELLPEGSVFLKDWERPEHDRAQLDAVNAFLEANTP
ncbi:MAG TPA: alpha/beta hydrolase [Rhodospirillaceae bacterium]|nr:alpha/beta hydrolase [Rhodospirillaceae bacterium]HAT34128.1 alpha/beta hydrolase [Rhodospirillaceae bacterium]